ncbi:type II toxin-antitoxin system RelE/ParE family toxin [Streptomyces sp. NPDC057539]|uniref:type II toxin-antitoxin system RelE family toxin n=1 Tax=Streptomyces sp. NPDC057539 TaxID=3346159 RepID=UPI0036C73AAD
MTYTMVWKERAMAEYRRLQQIDPIGAKNCVVAVRALADDPCPEAARQMGSSGFWRLPVGDWRVLYEVDGGTISVLVIMVGRVN